MGNKCIVMQNFNFCHFNTWNELDWNIQRIIWIGYYKNESNKKCLFPKLPKDIIKKIIHQYFFAPINMLGYLRLTNFPKDTIATKN